jgi:hypothetical protein
MYWIRIGTLLDLSIIASQDTNFNAAQFLGIPNSTLAGYTTGVRNIKESAVDDIAMRWTKYFDQNIRPMIANWETGSLSEFNISQTDLFGLYFHELFAEEDRLRLLCDPEPWGHSFGCCAAQVLAQFESDLQGSVLSFSKDDALEILRLTILHSGTYSEAEMHNLHHLALRYVLWRVKNREYFLLEHFAHAPKSYEVRDGRTIPLLTDAEQYNFLEQPADHRLFSSNEGIILPDVPRLKKAATMDVLLLCQSVMVKVNHVLNEKFQIPVSVCSCISPFCKEFGFAAAKAPH